MPTPHTVPAPAPATDRPAPDWPALQAAQAHDPAARVAFFIEDAGRTWHSGSVARQHLPALARWAWALQIDTQGATLRLTTAWRDEIYPVLGLRAGRRFQVARDIPEGFQPEVVSVCYLPLTPGLVPCNQDGELHSLQLMPVAQALAHAAAGEMTVDASLATLDFALRHRLLPANAHQHLQALAEPLWRGRASLDASPHH